ncbi:hypothetical protein MYX82_11425 [Acidobacteria bacterium AH-259-D05]|nr:hypothetical protein [Acidobacteria bacterium AH-259-D05]
MAKKCTSCGDLNTDDRLVACPNCGVAYSADPAPISTDQEHQIVQKLWKRLRLWLFGGFSVLTLVSVVLIVLSLIKAYTTGVKRLEDALVSRVEAEFQTERVTRTVQKVAADKATELMREEIAPVVDRFRNDTREAIDEAQETAEELRVVSEYTTAVISAQNDDRQAFDQLRVWANDENFPYSEGASRAWQTILDQHAQPFYVTGGAVPWPEDVDPGKLGISELRAVYSTAPAHVRPPLIEYIWERDDLAKVERLDFLADVLRSEQSLNAVERAGRIFNSATQQKYKPLAVDPMLSWYQQHRSDFQ